MVLLQNQHKQHESQAVLEIPLPEPNGGSSYVAEVCDTAAWHGSETDGAVSLAGIHSTIFGSLTAWSVTNLV